MKAVETKTFVRNKFAEYYQKNITDITPSSIEKREFGFVLLKEGIMIRHKAFQNVDGLKDFLKKNVSSDVYYSSAYYEKPLEDMEKKGWVGADLVFDIDADHLSLPCRAAHDTWICMSCKKTGKGVSPNRCPSCGAQRFDEKNWPCEICLECAKKEMITLTDFFMKDFGFSSKELDIFFSGHRGYHLHLESEEIQTLDSVSRREIADYVYGTGIETKFHGLGKGERSLIVGPNLDESGWRGRIAKGTYEILHTATSRELERFGLKKQVADILFRNKDRLIESWIEKGPWGILKGIGIESWRKIVQKSIENQSAKIDTVVTTDIHRLIRLPNTLHGKTGLKKFRVPINRIEGFDPFKEAVAFYKDSVIVFVLESPQFRLGDEIYGPYKRQKIELFTPAALLLLCKGLAKLAE